MLERSQVAIIIPAFNEASTIERVVNSVWMYGQPIVIDDCSGDETAKIAQKAGAIVVRHTLNQGYEGALNTGFLEAVRNGCSYVITFDADGQHHSNLIKQYLDYLEQGYDLVLGVRPQYARISEKIFAFYTKKRFGIQDPLCGMKGYQISLYKERGWFDGYKSVGTELALYSVLKKSRFVQVAIPIAERDGLPRYGQRLKANYKIMRALFLFIRKY